MLNFMLTVYIKNDCNPRPRSIIEPRHEKTNKMSVRPAKTQISLGIRPVWSESSLSAWRNLESLATHWAHTLFVGFVMSWRIYFSCICLFCMQYVSFCLLFFSHELAAAYDCDTPWTFHLPFCRKFTKKSLISTKHFKTVCLCKH